MWPAGSPFALRAWSGGICGAARVPTRPQPPGLRSSRLDKRLAIVGSETLLGREIREMLRSEDVPVQVSLVAGGGGEAKVLTEDDAEAVIMADLQSDAVTGADIVALCGSVESSKQTIALLRRAHSKARVIDATGALEDVPAALLRGPLAIDEKIEHAEGAIEVIAHPAALALALDRK